MKKILSILLALTLSSFALAQNVSNGPVTKKTSGANANDINEDLNIGSGRNVQVKSGGTLNGAGTFDFSAGTLSLANNQVGWPKVNKTGSSLADLATRSAADLTSGTLPDARFPATLPALSGANLTSLNASNLSSGTMPVARMPALSGGDATTSAGSGSITLATVNANVGTFGSATQVAQITLDGKGRATAASNVTVTPAFSSITGKPTTAAGYGITNGSTLDSWGAKSVPTGTVLGTTDTQTLTNKDLSSSTNTYRSASTSATGAVQLATSAETLTGTDASKVVTPAGWQFAASAIRNNLAPRGGIVFDSSTTAGRVTSTLTGQSLTTDSFSVTVVCEVWSGSVQAPIWYVGPNTSTAAPPSLRAYTESGHLRVEIGSATGGRIATVTSFATQNLGKTVLLTVTRSGNSISIYANNAQLSYSEGTYGSSAPAWGDSITSTYFMLGTLGSGHVYGGRIFSASLYNLVLAANDIQEIFEIGGAVPERFKFGSQSERSTGGDFSSSTGWTTNEYTISGGAGHASSVPNGASIYRVDSPLISGKAYKFAFDIANFSAGGLRPFLQIGASSVINGTARTANGSYSEILVAPNMVGTVYTGFLASGVTTVDFDNLSIKQVGAIVHLSLDEGIGYQLHDSSSNALDAVMSSSGVSHPRQVMSKTCGTMLFKARCGLALADWTFNAVVSGSAANVITVNTITRANGGGLPAGFGAADWFALGWLGWLSGGAPYRLSVLGSTALAGGAISLTLERGPGLANGSSVTLVPGCDRQGNTCRDKFANYDNFRGFEFMPSVSPSFVIPQRKASQGKK